MTLKDTFGKECWKRAKYYQDQNEKLEAKVKELEKTAQTAIEKFHGKRIDYDYAKEENSKLKAELERLGRDIMDFIEIKNKFEAALKIADEKLSIGVTEGLGRDDCVSALEKIKETLGEE